MKNILRKKSLMVLAIFAVSAVIFSIIHISRAQDDGGYFGDTEGCQTIYVQNPLPVTPCGIGPWSLKLECEDQAITSNVSNVIPGFSTNEIFANCGNIVLDALDSTGHFCTTDEGFGYANIYSSDIPSDACYIPGTLCTSNEDCSSGTVCNIDTGSCVSPVGTHAICQNNSCVSISGAGVNRCNTDADCGNGSPGDGPTHGVCDPTQSACVNVQGAGSSTCSTDVASCGGATPSHFTCQNDACLSVDGAGSSTCTTSADCLAPPPGFNVSLTPASISVNPGQTANYVVTVTSVGGASGGVDLGIWLGLPPDSSYTLWPNVLSLSPGQTVTSSFAVITSADTPPGPTTLEVEGTWATSYAASNPAIINVTSPSSITGVAAACNPSSILISATSSCTATVAGTGSYSSAVTWAVVSGGGSINGSGYYTAPGSPATVVVKATSVQDPTQSATTTITVSSALPPPTPTFTISPPSTSTTVGGSVQFHGWYDPDGAGPDPTVEVTIAPGIVWNSVSSTVATMSPSAPGEADALSAGATSIRAVYDGIGAAASLNVLSGTAPDYSIVVNPLAQAVTNTPTGITATYLVSISPLGGFSSSVSLSVGGLPSPITGSFDTSLITPTSSATLTINIPSTAGSGVTTFTVTGQSGATTHTAWPAIDILPSTGGGSPPGTHFECVNNACVATSSVPGDTENRCNTNADCGTPIGFAPPGVPPGGGSVHGACDATTQTCMNVAGSGPSTCSSDSPACGGGGEQSHLTCENYACLIVPGAGSNDCAAVGTSCAGGPPPTAPSCIFNGSPKQIVPPEQSTLTWACTGASWCSITNVGTVSPISGSTYVAPTTNTQYTLTCLGSGGPGSGDTYTSSVVISVSAPTIHETNP